MFLTGANEDDYVTIHDPETITIENDDTTTEKSAFNVPRTDLFNAAKVSVSGRSKSGCFSRSTAGQSTSSTANSSSHLDQLERYQSTNTSAFQTLSALRPTGVNQIGDDLAAYLLNDDSTAGLSYPQRRLLEFEIEYKH